MPFTRQHKTKVSCFCVSGMLLELPGPVLSQVLQDEAMLTTAIEKALRALQVAQEPRYRPDLSPSIILNRLFLDSMRDDINHHLLAMFISLQRTEITLKEFFKFVLKQ